MDSKQGGGMRGAGAWIRGKVAGRALTLLLALTPAWAFAARGLPEKPAGLDDAGWASLQQAIKKSVGQQTRLSAADGAAGDWLGYSVSLSGDTALVGAAYDGVGANSGQGSAYVFIRSGSTWTQQSQLTAGDGAAQEMFGSSVALSGDTALVGAVWDTVGANFQQGSAYVFTRSGSTWTQQAKLTAGDGEAEDEFGWSVALSGDTALVGAYGDDVGSNADQGSAYVFTRSGATWTQQAQLTAGDGAVVDWFGAYVALYGDTALVGAYLDDVGANVNQGSAYVFTRSGSVWAQQAKLTQPRLGLRLYPKRLSLGAAGEADRRRWRRVRLVRPLRRPFRRHRVGGGTSRCRGCERRPRLGVCLHPQRIELDAAGAAHGGRWRCVRLLRLLRRSVERNGRYRFSEGRRSGTFCIC